jgi:hypothetical protein
LIVPLGYRMVCVMCSVFAVLSLALACCEASTRFRVACTLLICPACELRFWPLGASILNCRYIANTMVCISGEKSLCTERQMGIQSLFRLCETLSPGAFKPMPRPPRRSPKGDVQPPSPGLNYDHVYYDVNNVIYTLIGRSHNEEQLRLVTVLL